MAGTIMPNKRTIVVASISACAGLVIGAAAASWFWTDFLGHFAESNMIQRTQSDIVTKVAVLEHLRKGRPDQATALLEGSLDGDLITIGAMVHDGQSLSEYSRRALELEQRARNASGYASPETIVQKSVQDAFRLTSSPSGKTPPPQSPATK